MVKTASSQEYLLHVVKALLLPIDHGLYGRTTPRSRGDIDNGLLESTVEPSVSGPPRKYYKITDEGRELLGHWKEEWMKTRDFVDAVLKGDIGQ